jgi:ElaB/YqjD/DUF883 family membrane-anchored ribosome-binding protein
MAKRGEKMSTKAEEGMRLRTRLEEDGRTVRARMDQTAERSRKAVQKHPLTAVGAGVAAGAIVGVVAATMVTTRKKDKAKPH